MRNPLVVLPDALKSLIALGEAADRTGLDEVVVKLVQLRASQINGCSVCAAIYARELRQAGESDERLFTVAAWRDTAWFSDAERAALALTEAVTRVADCSEPVSDEVWAEASRLFDETALAGLLAQIAAINAYNRVHVAVRQPVGPAELALVESASCARRQS
jgi:AhpD family alkylhydroperoxidase